MSIPFISKLPSATIMLIFIENALSPMSSIEIEHLFRCCLSSRHSRVSGHRLLKGNNLDRKRFQGSGFKTCVEFAFDFCDLLRGQSITVNSKQAGEIVVEVDQVERDDRTSRACDHDLSSAECERLQRRVKQ